MPYLQGVKDLHDAGWAHLDIKPDNLCMVMHPSTAQVHSYVIDYGSCHLQGAGKQQSSTASLLLLMALLDVVLACNFRQPQENRYEHPQHVTRSPLFNRKTTRCGAVFLALLLRQP